MIEGFESRATPTINREKSVLTNEEKVVSALDHNLSGVALERWMAMKATGTPFSSFERWIDDFNATSAEERGKGRYDHSRTLDEHIDITIELNTASGFPLQVTLHKNGELTLDTA